MTPEGMTLAEFLLARIAEDEKVATDAAYWGRHWEQDPMKHSEWVVSEKSGITTVLTEGGPREHIARFDPAYVLAECEAKRRIVQGTWGRADGPAGFNEGLSAGIHFACQVLASVYADHPDYDEKWTPTT